MSKDTLKCLFVHDHKFKKAGKRYFSEGKITDEVLSRYISSDDSLVVLSRMQEISNTENLSQITLENVEFIPVKGVSFPKVFSIHLLNNISLLVSSIQCSDFIIVRMPCFLGIPILSLNLFFRKKYFIEVVGDSKDSLLTSKPKPGYLLKALANIMDFLTKFYTKHANGAIYVTESALQNKYPNNKLTGHASNVEISIKQRMISYQDYGPNGNHFKIGLIGSFNNHYKGISDAINALKILSKKNHNVKLHILGSGTLQYYYESMAKDLNIADLVFFDGILEGGDNVIKWLESLDLYIQPSYTEGLPRALIEAMSTGLPAIASNVGGIPELLDSSALINPYDYKGLAEKIETFISSQRKRYEQGKSNYKHSKKYDKEGLKRSRSIFWKKAKDIVLKNN